jgi:CHAT domain-containing protein/Tfp pilus assembly protein PilF
VYDQQQQYEQAIADYQHAISLRPLFANAYGSLGWLLIEQGQFAKAQPYCLKAYQLDKSYYGWVVNLGHIYLLQGDAKTAREYYQETLTLLVDQANFENGPLADFDLFIKNDWQTVAAKTEKQWMQDNFAKMLPNIQKINDLVKQAEAYFKKGDYEKTEPLRVEVLTLREKALGKDHPHVAKSLNELAVLYYTQGKYSVAEPLYQRSLAIFEKALGKDHPEVAASLNNLAELYRTQGKYSEAEPLLQRSLAISEKALGKDHPNFATSLNNLALLYQAQGKYSEAEPLIQRSLAIREKALGKDHPDVASSLNNLALLYKAQGKYSEAEPLIQSSLVIREKALGKDRPDVANSLNNLAFLYNDQGRYSEAEPLVQRSLAIFEKALGKDHPDVATSLNNLAELYQDQGKYSEAEPLIQRSLTISEKALGKYHPTVATSLNNLAELYQDQGKYSEAEPLIQRSLTISEKALGKYHPTVATSLNNLAGLYKAQGKYSEAEPLIQRSLTIWEKALGKDHPDVALSLNNLAELYRTEGKYSEAEPLYQRCLAINEKALGKDHPHVANSLQNVALLYQAQGKSELAASKFKESLRLSNQSLERWLWGAGEKTRQSYMKQEESRHDAYLTFYALQNTPEEAFYFSLSRKGLLLRIASEVGSLAKQSTDPAIQKQVQDFTALRTQLASLAFSGKADKKVIQDLEEKINTLEMELSQQVSSFKRSKTEVTSEEVLEKLGNEQVVLDFLVYTEFDFKNRKYKTDQVIALIANKAADKKDRIKLIKLGELAPIAAAINSYQTAIVPNKDNANSREQTLKQNAQTLYNQLWQPLTPYLQNKKTVYLIPDGVLHLLPFKALQDKDGHYLAESLQLITLSSARDIVLPPLTGKTSTAAIFAAPDYGDTKTSTDNTTRGIDLKNIYFQPLASALQEGQQIQKLFFKKQPDSPATLLMKQKATEQAVTASTSPKILHLATHGFFLEDTKPDEKALTHGLMHGIDQDLPLGKIDNPLTHSGLAFAGANAGVQGNKQSDGTDGILTALEVLNLHLEGTDLVTLSACDTGKGDVKIGEGVYSLNRAFQEAGAKAVLSTLWSVDDQATEKFMQAFYNRFLDGKPAQQAIQETQDEFMKDEKYRNPFYWAGFVMMGKE